VAQNLTHKRFIYFFVKLMLIRPSS